MHIVRKPTFMKMTHGLKERFPGQPAWFALLAGLSMAALGVSAAAESSNAARPETISSPQASAGPLPVKLRCEYSADPLGLGERQPRLSWQLSDARTGARQTAYRIHVAGSRDQLLQESGLSWDSGRVETSQALFVRYDGPTPVSRQRLWWRVRLWDAQGQPTGWSEPAFWEMGLLDPADWSARWIESTLVGGPRTPAPAPFFRRKFTVASDVASARLYLTALGLYECMINGQRVGDGVFRPGWTVYPKRVQYDAYDVTALLRSGDNVIGAILGDGWYAGRIASQDRQIYGDRPRLLAQLEITRRDGSRQVLATDESWRWAAGPILEADLIQGEAYDARLELTGWDQPGFDDKGWQAAALAKSYPATLVAPAGPPVRRRLELKPVADPRRAGKGRYIFDLGQNLSGWVRLRGVVGPAGTTLKLRHAEMLQASGELYTENLRTARATDYYTLSGRETAEGTWEPRFTSHGFRYVELAGLPEGFVPSRETVTGIVAHSAMQVTGSFECSESLLNQLQSNIVWSQRGNFVDVPTDCPQRDERLGWTGDAQVFVRTAAFNMDVAGFFAKWQDDFADSQEASGAIPAIIPNPTPKIGLEPGDAGPAWSDAMVICPWTIYRCYGDTRILERHYLAMSRYLRHLEQISPGLIRSSIFGPGWGGFGDWLALDSLGGSDQSPTPKDLIGTAYFARVAGQMADVARVLGKPGEVAEWSALRVRIIEAFNREFVTPGGRIQGGNQTSYLLALGFDLLPEEKRGEAVRHLRQAFERKKWHLSTGFVGTPLIAPTLSRFGGTEDAYRVLLQRDYPGWLFSIAQGATTIWERWNSYSRDRGFGPVGMNSFNHYAYGAIGEWMYATIAGIDLDPDPLVPAFRRSVIRPQPGGGLTWARGSLDTPYGELSTSWTLQDRQFVLDVLVPPNTDALVVLPVDPAAQVTWRVDGASRTVTHGQGIPVSAGRHRFESSTPGAAQ
jgi:alpha-L-rhamnosidase